MKEARLLHFWRNDKATPPTAFQLSNPGSKGMPVDIPLQQTFTEAKVLTESYETGLLEAITAVVGEGGIMDGWDVYAIGKCKANWDGVRNVNVLVVREKAQVAKDNWSQFDSEATPDSSVTSD
ncbi:MAG: hypothetical protein L6R40_004917 [Gallowayella cf. fulva]|nr:MAG: hypothetical protein L6R40_004917 [Xanthomendoza cf. fulva]